MAAFPTDWITKKKKKKYLRQSIIDHLELIVVGWVAMSEVYAANKNFSTKSFVIVYGWVNPVVNFHSDSKLCLNECI